MPVVQTMYFLDITCINLDCKPVRVKKMVEVWFCISLQVTQSVYNILCSRGYTFECRGLVAVKGKGKMVTYWMIGKEGDQSS